MPAAGETSNITHAVIPAAGLGTRMRQLTGGGPKELLEIDGIPLIHYTVQEALEAGIKSIIVIVSPRKPSLREFLTGKTTVTAGNNNAEYRSLREAGASIEFIEQDQPSGLAHAVSLAEPIVKKDDFLLLMPDNFFPERISPSGQLIRSCNPGRCCLGILKLTSETRPLFSKSGAVKFEKTEKRSIVKVTSLGFKQKMSISPFDEEFSYRIVGRSVYSCDFFEAYRGIKHPRGSEQDDLPVLYRLLSDEKVDGCLLSGTGFDAGNPAGYTAAKAWKSKK